MEEATEVEEDFVHPSMPEAMTDAREAEVVAVQDQTVGAMIVQKPIVTRTTTTVPNAAMMMTSTTNLVVKESDTRFCLQIAVKIK